MRFGIVCLPESPASAAADARLAEQVGFDWFGVVDSQSVYRELYATLAVCAQATERIALGPTVTNPVTRHPAVAASAIATIGELAPGRTFFGLGSGDSAVLNLAARPGRLAALREYLGAMRDLHRDGTATYHDRAVNLSWAGPDIPLYLAAEGPKTLELAGEIADGVIVNLGLDADLLRDARRRIAAGAERAGRDPDALDVWTLVRVNVCDDVAVGIEEIKMELASNAHHVFRFTLEGKRVPADMVAAIERVQRGYVPAAHEHIDGPNAALVDEPSLLGWLADRFAVVGTPEACAERLRDVAEAGIDQFLFTGFVRDRPRLIRALGENVLPLLR